MLSRNNSDIVSAVSLLHEVGEEYTKLLEKFAKLPHTAETKVNPPLLVTFLITEYRRREKRLPSELNSPLTRCIRASAQICSSVLLQNRVCPRSRVGVCCIHERPSNDHSHGDVR